MFSIAVKFLTQRVVAATTSKADEVEWPIHPARLFMAMAAAHYESCPTDDERKILEWLEALPPPTIHAPIAAIRETQTVFVPVNDKLSDPARRVRQPRQFPSAFVGDSPARFCWEDDVPDGLRNALSGLASKVVRLGHSSSLVQCWVEIDEQISPSPKTEVWKCVGAATGNSRRLRTTSPGLLKTLERDMNEAAISEYADLKLLSRDGDTAEKKKAKKELKDRFPNDLPVSRRPSIGTSKIYTLERAAERQAEIIRTVFDPVPIVMTKIDGRTMGLESTLLMCDMMRNAVLTHCGSAAPSWLTGHEPDGSSTSKPHIAFVPLPFIDSEYADGHVLGLGMFLPRDLSDEDKSDELADFLVDDLLEPRRHKLTLGNNGIWELQREDRTKPPAALTPETWTQPSRVWATVTPVVLDRHPKTNRQKDLAGWRSEVSAIVCRSCQHIGLPAPSTIRIEKHSFLKGVPSSRPGRTGFPLMAHSDGKTRRIQTHVRLEFDQLVQGPVILGAGRFRGYGFCKPVFTSAKEDQS